MKLDSARSLKKQLLGLPEVTAPRLAPAAAARLGTAGSFARPRRASARAAAVASPPRPAPLAVGIRGCGKDYRIAVRVQQTFAGLQSTLDRIAGLCRQELDVRHVGRVVAQAPRRRRRLRPLEIGSSVGHHAITAGTLGAFVVDRGRSADEAYILSNNHVLANENHARKGDAILQPGDLDRGRRPRDVVARLSRFVRLKKRRNTVDAAIAAVDEDLEYFYDWIRGKGRITGVRDEPLDEGETVYKLGRTTGLRKGRVSAIEVDDLLVGYEEDLAFDGQIEVEPVGRRPFSLGGDSGSLVIDSRRRAVGLLFAGNDTDATYINPIGRVLEALRVELLL